MPISMILFDHWLVTRVIPIAMSTIIGQVTRQIVRWCVTLILGRRSKVQRNASPIEMSVVMVCEIGGENY